MKAFFISMTIIMTIACASTSSRYPKSLDQGIFSDTGPKEYFLVGPFDEMFSRVNSYAKSEDVESASK